MMYGSPHDNDVGVDAFNVTSATDNTTNLLAFSSRPNRIVSGILLAVSRDL